MPLVVSAGVAVTHVRVAILRSDIGIRVGVRPGVAALRHVAVAAGRGEGAERCCEPEADDQIAHEDLLD
jgi:hypothetical protein